MVTYPNTYLWFHASNMILNVDSDAAYLVAPKGGTHIADCLQFNHTSNPKYDKHLNEFILVDCTTMFHVVSSTAEAETA